MTAETRLPDTWLTREAYEAANSAAPLALLHHSIRVYLLGKLYAREKRIDFDDEGLYLAALFHDLGLCPAYWDGSRAFQLNGGRALRRFLGERRVPPERAAALGDAVDFHMLPFPRWSKGSVAGLLQIGAWMDIARLRAWGRRDSIRDVEATYPRLGIGLKFPRMVLGSIGSPRSCLGLMFPGVRSGFTEDR